jgi:hypothetical protein
VRAFACPRCSALIFFENSVCVSCGTGLGYVRSRAAFVALERGPDGRLAHVEPEGSRLVPCANLRLATCNWLTREDAANGLCPCCELTRTRPANSDTDGLAAFARAELAKRRLLFQLDGFWLPTTPRTIDSHSGLAFDLLSSADRPVITGHDSGVITIDLAEGSDPHREAVRANLGEPYRTLLGHLRHEVGHWYWSVLVDQQPTLGRFREMFGDETVDYSGALAGHYGSPRGDAWRTNHISDYAAAHPWEDWAETFAHYLHLTDTLQTAYEYGIAVTGPRVDVPAASASSVSTSPLATYRDFDQQLEAWLSLTAALNAVNRSMGSDDLYPFVLVPAVISKLQFVHEVITAAGPLASG